MKHSYIRTKNADFAVKNENVADWAELRSSRPRPINQMKHNYEGAYIAWMEMVYAWRWVYVSNELSESLIIQNAMYAPVTWFQNEIINLNIHEQYVNIEKASSQQRSA